MGCWVGGHSNRRLGSNDTLLFEMLFELSNRGQGQELSNWQVGSYQEGSRLRPRLVGVEGDSN